MSSSVLLFALLVRLERFRGAFVDRPSDASALQRLIAEPHQPAVLYYLLSAPPGRADATKRMPASAELCISSGALASAPFVMQVPLALLHGPSKLHAIPAGEDLYGDLARG